MYSTLEYLISSRDVLHRPVYVISDSKMRELDLQRHQLKLDLILDQRKRLDEAYERQSKCLDDSERLIQKEIKALSSSTLDSLQNQAKNAVEGAKETVKNLVETATNP